MLTMITSLSLSSGRFIQPLIVEPENSGLEIALPRITFARALSRVSRSFTVRACSPERGPRCCQAKATREKVNRSPS